MIFLVLYNIGSKYIYINHINFQSTHIKMSCIQWSFDTNLSFLAWAIRWYFCIFISKHPVSSNPFFFSWPEQITIIHSFYTAIHNYVASIAPNSFLIQTAFKWDLIGNWPKLRYYMGKDWLLPSEHCFRGLWTDHKNQNFQVYRDLNMIKDNCTFKTKYWGYYKIWHKILGKISMGNTSIDIKQIIRCENCKENVKE